MKVNPKLFIISAPSGGGKTTVAMHVIEKLDPMCRIKKVITYTSRPPRPGEQDGHDYYFISQHDFFRKKQDGFFLESTIYNGHFYGSSREAFDVLSQQTILIMIANWDGAYHMKSVFPDTVLIWLTAPNLQTLRQRITQRGTQEPQEIEERMEIARYELMQEARERIFAYHVLNVDLQQTVQSICDIIINKVQVS